MREDEALRREIRSEVDALWRLAGPAVATQVGAMAMSVVDTLMVARVSTEALAAATIANVWSSLLLYCSMGLLFGLDPIVSQAHGRGDGPRAGRALQSGVVLALLLAVPIVGLYAFAAPVLQGTGQDPALAALAGRYLEVQLTGIPAFLVFVALRQYLQGRTLVLPAMWCMAIANLFNVVANWALIFGHLGFPAMGLRGAGHATNAVRIALLVMLVAWVGAGRHERRAWVAWSREALRLDGIREILRYGVPVWLQMLLEIGAFAGSALVVGWLGVAALGAHAVALNLASLSFMVPMGVSMAASTRVGNLFGAGDQNGVHRAARVGLGCGAIAQCVAATAFLGFPAWLTSLYTADPEVVALCLVLLPIAGAFQFFDGTQVVACGILRGLGRTRPAAVANFFAYWVFGLPVGVWLAFRGGLDVAGIWVGFGVGLAIVAVVLARLVLRITPLEGEAAGRAWGR